LALHDRWNFDVTLEGLSASPLAVPLLDPFVIASGRVDATRAAEIEAVARTGGRRASGLGEAACLPPVTREDQDDVLQEVERATRRLAGISLHPDERALEDLLRDVMPDAPVTRVAVETALLDAIGRLAGVPLRTLLGGGVGAATDRLQTDVTVAIGEPARMGELARAWTARGFLALKVKVGKDVDTDARALEAIARAAPGARLRIDANGGYSVEEALALADACARLGVTVECWEQPCSAHDHDGMRRVADALEAPVVADESVKTADDLHELLRLRYADGVNLKLGKVGSLLAATRMGVEARAGGLAIMAGGMVETRLGMTAAAHVACAIGGVDFVDLDTALLLADDPYEGGYEAEGPRYVVSSAPGLGLRRRNDSIDGR
jgi:L-alanine-DL-glutamate epimerase-like enolase superfamily enzyme